ncbi:hypothetical protein RJ639_003042 [Escallonia herrerae]|uniref:DDB1- and CUL4-associated factor 8 n=1 Tax=Escallonia herrerae TaxID=1293975 RepID=A0AA89AX55_9ASTE|nr:hypothetical protein RJ639_003042 [Escallonia herrerae]
MDTTSYNSGHGVLEFFRREALVKKIDLYGKLNGHQSCVNAVEFNFCGDVLVSGSDDRQVIFWNWAAKTFKFVYDSGHSENIFQVRIMPFTDDCKIVTSAADGQVRLGEVRENSRVETKKLGRHQGGFDLRSNSVRRLLRCSSFPEDNQQSSSSIGLNAIVIDPRSPNYFAVGGADEFARIYDIRKNQRNASSNLGRPVNTFCPRHLVGTHSVHITGLDYSNLSELLVSYIDEFIYLFQKYMGFGPTSQSFPHKDLQYPEDPQVYSGHGNAQTVKGASFFGPNDEYIMSGSDCGHIFFWKKKEAEIVRLMVGDCQIVNHLEPHPNLPVLASCGIEKKVKLWAPMSKDVRPLPHDAEKIMESNRRGREDQEQITFTPDVIMHVLRLHRRQPFVYTERRYNRADIESDEEDEREAYLLGFSDGDGSSEEGTTGNSRDCNIS